MLHKLQSIIDKQKEINKKLVTEDFSDLHSILRVKQLCEKYLEFEIKKDLLIEIISKNGKM